jgi:hypothetical protein
MSHWHATDIVSLVFGSIFAGIAVVWLLRSTDVIDFGQVWLAGPAILVIAGTVGLLAALRSQRQRPPT